MAGRDKVFKDQGTVRQKTRDDAVDAAQWDYEREVADEVKILAEAIAGYDFDEATGTLTSAAATTWREAATATKNQMVAVHESGRKSAVAAAEAARVNGNAADYASWVNDVGQLNVDFASDVKDAIDQLASDLKTLEDQLTTDQANAAKALATSLANKEKTSEIDSATAGENAGNSLAPIDGNDGINATARDNAEREKLVHNRGTYETEIRQEHAAKMQAATAPAGAMQNLLGFQRSVATHDVTWSASKGQAIDVAQLAYSATYTQQSQGLGGADGADLARTAAAGLTQVTAVTAQSNAEENFTIAATGHLADYSVQSSSAATKALRDGVKAETNYDLARVTAQKVYFDAEAAANIVRTGKYVAIQVAIYLDQAIPHVPATYQNPQGTTDESNREGRIAAANAAIEAEYQAAEKAARAVFAGQVGDGQITRAGDLGDVLVGEATEQGDASIVYVNTAATDNGIYEPAITAMELARVTSEGAYGIAYSNRLAELQKNLTAALGTANIGLTQALGTANIAKATSLATAQASFWAAERGETAARYTTWLQTQSTTYATFMAAQATAQSQWTTGIGPSYVAYSTAMAQADGAQYTALATAVAAQDNALETANVAYVAATEPLYAQASLDRMQAERAWVEDKITADDAHWLAEETAQKTYDIAIAGGVKTQGIGYATAEKAYQVGAINLPSGGDLAALLKTHNVAFADADIAHETTAGNSDVTWTTAIANANKTWQQDTATVGNAFDREMARIIRDTTLAINPHDVTLQIAFGNAIATSDLAFVTAGNDFRSAEYLAIANYQQASGAAKGTSISSLATTVNLPWMDWQSQQATLKADWFVSDGKEIFLALGAEVNSADLAYQSSVNTLYLAWLTATANATKVYADAKVTFGYSQMVGGADSSQQYVIAGSNAERDWQVATAEDRKSVGIGQKTAIRNYVNDQNESARSTAHAAVEAAHRAALDGAAGAFTIADTAAAGAEQIADGQSRFTFVQAMATQGDLYVATKAAAKRVQQQGIAAADAVRQAASFTAVTTEQVQSAQGFAAAVHAWAANHPNPWATYDDIALTALTARDTTVWQAETTRDVAASNAVRDMIFTAAAAHETATNALQQAADVKLVAVEGALLTQTTTQVAANAARSQTVRYGSYETGHMVAGGGGGGGGQQTGRGVTRKLPTLAPIARAFPEGVVDPTHLANLDYDAIANMAPVDGRPAKMKHIDFGQGISVADRAKLEQNRLANILSDHDGVGGDIKVNSVKDLADDWPWWTFNNRGKYTMSQVIVEYKKLYGDSDPLLVEYLARQHGIGLGDRGGSSRNPDVDVYADEIWVEEDMMKFVPDGEGYEYYDPNLQAWIYHQPGEWVPDPEAAAELLRKGLVEYLVTHGVKENGFLESVIGSLPEMENFRKGEPLKDEVPFEEIVEFLRTNQAAIAAENVKTIIERAKIGLSVGCEPLDFVITLCDLLEGDKTALIGLIPILSSGAVGQLGDAASDILHFRGGGDISRKHLSDLVSIAKNKLDPEFVKKWIHLTDKYDPQQREALLYLMRKSGIDTEDELRAFVNQYPASGGKVDYKQIELPLIREIIRQGGCFAAGTPILTPRGAVLIENLRPGDEVLSRSDLNFAGPVEPRTVEKVFVRVGRICEIDVAGRCLMTTAEHPFYVQSRGWIKALDLKPGDLLLGHDGQTHTVERVHSTDREATVYNLRVAEYHTYFVGSPDWGFDVWVHNTYIAMVEAPAEILVKNSDLKGKVGIFDDKTKRFFTKDPITGDEFTKVTADEAAKQWNRAALRGKLEGKRSFDVFDPKTGQKITDIDHIQDEILWEEKLNAKNASNVAEWVQDQITQKFRKYLEARAVLNGFEKADIGFRLNKNAKSAFKEAILKEIERLRAAHPDVVIHIEWGA